MDIPESMKAELQACNNGKGIDLESWIGLSGNFSLAVGYASIFCPKFIQFEDYIFVGEDMDDDSIKTVRAFEKGNTPQSVEIVINHFHIWHLHYVGCPDLSVDKVIVIGEALKNIYEARLQYLFPERPCTVEFFKPEDSEDIEKYYISFWQKKHESKNA